MNIRPRRRPCPVVAHCTRPTRARAPGLTQCQTFDGPFLVLSANVFGQVAKIGNPPIEDQHHVSEKVGYQEMTSERERERERERDDISIMCLKKWVTKR